MKNIIVLFFLLVLSGVSYAQKNIEIKYNEVITYKTHIGWQKPPEHLSTLYINDDESCFILLKPYGEVKHLSVEKGDIYYDSGTKYPNFIINKYKSDHLTFLGQFFKKYCLVKDNKPSIQWKISNEKKKVGEYTIQKATGEFRGRKYTAWFSSQVPLSLGPWKLIGLPGLIFEAYDSTGNVSFQLTSIKNKKGKIKFDVAKLENKTWKEYKDCYQKSWKKMSAYLTSFENENLNVSTPKISVMELTLIDEK